MSFPSGTVCSVSKSPCLNGKDALTHHLNCELGLSAEIPELRTSPHYLLLKKPFSLFFLRFPSEALIITIAEEEHQEESS